jgi:hypothetical protein
MRLVHGAGEVKSDEEKQRQERNREICDKVKAGAYIPAKLNLQESWFPKRPIIKKDPKAIEKLYKG